MSLAGAKQKDIAAALGVTQGAVSKIFKRHRQTGVPTPRPRSGRPRKTTEREDRYLVGHWRHVIFSDESRFVVYREDGRVMVRRQAHEALNEDCIMPRVQGGGGGVTVWGAFHSTGKCDLHVLDGHMN
ncbi:uncharacterized protein LOC135478141 [Liolophura sinensis]|uniref:uncharacterized protein LOC135478141 n=1 Tax=Liolophura sinensis TaxID=3198878 RepID=UPI003158B965